MGFLDVARDALKDLPVSEVVRERLSFALDRLEDVEKKNGELTAEKGRLQGNLDRERGEHQRTREDLQRLRDEHAEEIRIQRTIEFRRGKRTGGEWAAFCPKCHLPAGEHRSPGGVLSVSCTDFRCGWHVYPGADLGAICREIKEA